MSGKWSRRVAEHELHPDGVAANQEGAVVLGAARRGVGHHAQRLNGAMQPALWGSPTGIPLPSSGRSNLQQSASNALIGSRLSETETPSVKAAAFLRRGVRIQCERWPRRVRSSTRAERAGPTKEGSLGGRLHSGSHAPVSASVSSRLRLHSAEPDGRSLLAPALIATHLERRWAPPARVDRMGHPQQLVDTHVSATHWRRASARRTWRRISILSSSERGSLVATKDRTTTTLSHLRAVHRHRSPYCLLIPWGSRCAPIQIPESRSPSPIQPSEVTVPVKLEPRVWSRLGKKRNSASRIQCPDSRRKGPAGLGQLEETRA